MRTYELVYLDERVASGELPDDLLPSNGLSLLSQVKVTGHDDLQEREEDRTEELPPLEFGYTRFEPEDWNFFPLEGELRATSLASTDLELVDLSSDGLMDMVQLNGVPRYPLEVGIVPFFYTIVALIASKGRTIIY